MLFEGIEYKPRWDGNYFCPWPCSDPNYPPRRWKSEKGFAKHLSECKAKPGPELVWVPKPKMAQEVFCECDDCGDPIYKITACWQIGSRVVCWDCHEPYLEAGMGYHEAAGLKLPAVMLEG